LIDACAFSAIAACGSTCRRSACRSVGSDHNVPLDLQAGMAKPFKRNDRKMIDRKIVSEPRTPSPLLDYISVNHFSVIRIRGEAPHLSHAFSLSYFSAPYFCFSAEIYLESLESDAPLLLSIPWFILWDSRPPKINPH
jgi:hypothetical protein